MAILRYHHLTRMREIRTIRSQHHASCFSDLHVAIEGDFYLLTLNAEKYNPSAENSKSDFDSVKMTQHVLV